MIEKSNWKLSPYGTILGRVRKLKDSENVLVPVWVSIWLIMSN